MIWTLYPAVAVIAIGGIWPTIVGLLVGAGLGRKRQTAVPNAIPIETMPTESAIAIPPPPSEPITPDKAFGTQRDQFYPTEIHSDPPK